MTWLRALVLGSFLITLSGTVWAYKYWDRDELKEDLASQVDTKVKVVDEILSTFPDRQSIPGYFKFDTVHFRCLIPSDNSDAIEYVKSVAAQRDPGARRTKRLVTLEAKVERREVYGKVDGKAGGVSSESIFLIVDKASRPRARYFREIK